jgi:cell division protein FtsQ
VRAAALRTIPALASPGRLPARVRRRLLVSALAAVLAAAGYLLWFRDSGLVRIREVTVTGVTGKEAPAIRKALTTAARGMTTLHVRVDELERAVARYPAVGSIEVGADFPRALRVDVAERVPVALVGARRTPVAADGTVLQREVVRRPIPVVESPAPIRGARLRDPGSLARVDVVSAAPGVLAGRVKAVETAPPRGIVVSLRAGPELVFGSRSRIRAKWAAAARVLAHPAAGGASYIDLRIPQRPAAGGLDAPTIAPVIPAGPAAARPPAAVPTVPQAQGPGPGAAPPLNSQP